MELASEEANLVTEHWGCLLTSCSHGARAPTPGEYIMSVLTVASNLDQEKGMI